MSYNVKQLAEKLGLTVRAGEAALDNNVNGMYIGDLLSWVMGKAQDENAWVTIQGHLNVVAVALLTGVSCIIVAESAEIDADTIEKANKEDIPMLSTNLSSFEVAQRFCAL